MSEARDRGAVISDDGRYRYHLWRTWDDLTAPQPRPMGFVMLNPSTADGTVDDPTIRRCLGFARREGCTALNVANLFAYRCTDPGTLREANDPVGPENHLQLDRMLDVAEAFDAPLVAAWGASGPTVLRLREAIRFVDLARSRGVQLWCLGTTAVGAPRHPLYVAGRQPLVPLHQGRL